MTTCTPSDLIPKVSEHCNGFKKFYEMAGTMRVGIYHI